MRSRSGIRWTCEEPHSISPMANLFEQSWLPAVKMRSEPSWRRKKAALGPAVALNTVGLPRYMATEPRAVLVDDRP